MLNQPLFSAGEHHINEQAIVPVYIEDTNGAEAISFSYLDVTVKYANANSSSLVSFVPGSGDFKNLGRGMYLLTLPASGMTPLGPVIYVVSTVATGYTNFRGAGEIVEDHFVVKFSISYDFDALEFISQVWLERKGQIVTTPTSCAFDLYDSDETLIVGQVSSSATVNGVFIMTSTAITLAAKTNFVAKCRVTFNGRNYTSIDGAVSFN